MNGTSESRKEAYFAAPEIEAVFGTPEALDDADAATVMGIIDYIRSRPALGKADRVALVAIAALSEDQTDLARSLIAELLGK
jgi:hypothetical protein